MVYDLLVGLGYYIVFLIISVLIGALVGWIVYKIVEYVIKRYINKAYDKLKETFSKVPSIDVGALVSYVVGIIIGIYVFSAIMGILPNIVTSTQFSYISYVYSLTSTVASYLLQIAAVVLVIAAGVIFSVFFTSYIYLLVEGYSENVAELLRLLLFLGLIWIITVYSLNLLGLGLTLFKNIIGVFVVLSVGLIVMNYITDHIDENEYYKNVKPFVQVFIYSLFVISSLSILLLGYSTVSAELQNIFAWGFVILFVLALLPFVVKAIKEAL
ncbi:hypothetical protein YN1_4570 [Nanoarchaeota archaeon]